MLNIICFFLFEIQMQTPHIFWSVEISYGEVEPSDSRRGEFIASPFASKVPK